MESYSPPLKKLRPEGFTNGGSVTPSFDGASFKLINGFPSERESFPPNIGSKSKACLKYFSTSGCPYGEGCHFSHYIPGGVASLGPSQASRVTGNGAPGVRKGPLAHHGMPLPRLPYRERGTTPTGFKTRLCKRFESAEGCTFGPNCHFAHGEQELKKSNGFADIKGFDRFAEPTPPGLAAAASFGEMSTAKVCINSSLAGIIVGRGGANAKAISRATGARLYIRDHESDGNLKNVEMEGSLDQIKLASGMVRELLAHKDITPVKPGGLGSQTYKSKLCANFVKGSCTYGDRCHFAHGEGELRQAAPV